jgi:hypothetical protein
MQEEKGGVGMETSKELYFEELEAQEELEWWGYALAISGGIACGAIVYVAVAAT